MCNPPSISQVVYQTVCVLDLSTPITVETDVTCADATKILSDNGIDQIPVVNSEGLVGTYNTYMYVHIQTLLFTFFVIKTGTKNCVNIVIKL